ARPARLRADRGGPRGRRRHRRPHHRSPGYAGSTATNHGTRNSALNRTFGRARSPRSQNTRGEPMRTTLRPLTALAMVAMVVVISAGCGGTHSSGAASTTDTASKSSTTSDKNATGRDKAVKFAACMRENGYADFPDPKASGEFPDFGISVSPAVWTRALGACKELQPPGSFSAHLNPKQMSAALKFARCIRAKGVKDFPDPVQGEPIVDTTRIPSANRPGGMSILNAAMRKCSAFGPRGNGG